jgi:hypothetical protein
MRRKAAWVASKPSRVITLGLAVALESFTEESLGGGNVARSTEVACLGNGSPVTDSINFTPTKSTVIVTTSGTWSLPGNCSVTGTATLTNSGSMVNITINGQEMASLYWPGASPIC